MGKHVIIVGAGVIGLSCAYYLQKQGHRVLVIDRGDITTGTSFGNAGYVSPSHIIPLASPGIISQGLRWMLHSGSPFYIKPRFDLDLFKWLWAFRKAARYKTMQSNIPSLHHILQLSRGLMTEMRLTLGDHFRMKELGCLMLYKTASTEKHEWELADRANELGIETQKFTAQGVQDLEPQLEVNVRGGVLYPQDCHLHPGDFMYWLKTHLKSTGVEFQLEAEVNGFEWREGVIRSVHTSQGNFDGDQFIIAAGSWLPSLARQLDFSILLQAGKGYSVTYQDMPVNLKYPAILVDARVAMTPMGNDLRMGGTMEISGINNKILINRVEAIFNASKNYYHTLPVQFPSVNNIWSGLRPLSPDGLPYIGRPKSYRNLIVAGGHAMLGLSLAAGTGKVVEELVDDKLPSIDLTAFHPDRFGA